MEPIKSSKIKSEKTRISSSRVLRSKKNDVSVSPSLEPECLSSVPENKLYNILKNNRKELPEFLEKYGDYKNLVNDITDMEVKYGTEKNPNVLEELLIKKNSVITELPTHELITVLKCLVAVLQIKLVCEIYARTGILSLMLKKHFFVQELNDVKIKSLDFINDDIKNDQTYSCVEKFDSSTFYREIVINNTLLILNWPSTLITEDVSFSNTLRDKNVPAIVILGDFMDNITTENRFCILLSSLGYRMLKFPVKQISWGDYFYKNKFYPKNSSVSTLTLFILVDRMNLTKEFIISMCGENNFLKERYSIPESHANNVNLLQSRRLIQDLVIRQKIPEWILNIENESEFLKVYVFCAKILKNKYFYIPYWIKDIPSLTFWYLSTIHRVLPEITKSDEKKFYEYMSKINNLQHEGLQCYKDKKIISPYIVSIKDAEKFILLDFSTVDSDKTWKNSYEEFVLKFNITFRTIEEPII
jgi:hypothetical protein